MNSKKFSLTMLIIFISLAVLVLYHNISPYVSPSELLMMKKVSNVQVTGLITDLEVDGGISRFKLTDGKAEIDVIYSGDLQQYNTEVVVVGDWSNGTLYAKEILKKCHTEYTGG